VQPWGGVVNFRFTQLSVDQIFASVLARPSPSQPKRSFQDGSRPVIRWIKGDGLDDAVTRTAIAQATRLFGDSVDYCLCTAGIPAARVRRILAWATQPVEWFPVSASDNAELASVLMKSGCDSDHFGYWWKWFPERVRPAAPEWVLDGDMVVVAAPEWFDAWKDGVDGLRVSQDDRWPVEGLYGEYVSLVDQSLRLYSGIVSLPPHLRYLPNTLAVLKIQPLARQHNGCENMSEQGVMAAAFTQLAATPIPLSEFPFGRAFEDFIDYGLKGPAQHVWGYHFGNAFRRENPHFGRLSAEGVLFSQDEPTFEHRFAWLRNFGQWGRPGWSMHPDCARKIGALAGAYAGRSVLEIGTSRGHLTAILASQGCSVTTIDAEDRGAKQNLEGLNVQIVQGEAIKLLRRETQTFDFIVVDLHGNDEANWRRLWPYLKPRLSRIGTMVLYNSHLWKIDEFRTETGLRWVAEYCLSDFAIEVFEDPPPGMIVCRYS
jgi:predicted O-methyltransferase YrrM